MKIITSLSILFLLAAMPFADQVYTKNKKANQLYKRGEFKEALKMYEDLSVQSPLESKIKMNKGSAHYQLGDIDKAEEAYNAAAAGCKDKKTLADLYYNLGNIQYMQGEELSAQGKQEAMDKYKGALENYIKSLDRKPYDKDAKWNLQLASAKIKQMQNQKQNQQQNNKDKNKDDKQQNNSDKNKDQQNKDQQKKDDKQQENKDQQNQQNDKKQEQQKPEPTPAQKKEDMKKDEAKKLLELYSDDEHDLNKKPEKQGVAGEKRNEKDW